jgi:hypothetical protein
MIRPEDFENGTVAIFWEYGVNSIHAINFCLSLTAIFQTGIRPEGGISALIGGLESRIHSKYGAVGVIPRRVYFPPLVTSDSAETTSLSRTSLMGFPAGDDDQRMEDKSDLSVMGASVVDCPFGTTGPMCGAFFSLSLQQLDNDG